MLKFLKSHFRLFVSLLAALLAASGCAATSALGKPLSINEIPVPPGSHIFEGSYESTMDMMYITTRRAFGVSNHNCEANALHYLLEFKGYDMDEYLSFYQTAFATTDWNRDKTVDLPGVQRWRRPSTKGDQALTLGVIPFAGNDSTDFILMVVLVTGDTACRQ